MTKLWSIKEFAELLGVSRDTVERAIKNKKLKAVKKNPFAGRTSPLLIPDSEVQKARRQRNDPSKS